MDVKGKGGYARSGAFLFIGPERENDGKNEHFKVISFYLLFVKAIV